MICALYKEDRVDEQITDKKISATLKELGQNPCRGQIIVFEKGRLTIGYAILIFYWSNEYGGDVLHVDELYVKPEHRQRGVATSFFRHLSETFKHKARLVQLEVSPTNTKAMNYYRKLGFKHTRNAHLARDIILGMKSNSISGGGE
jgi:ribosomal protein S18 acetylase RimI-like enzyme